MGVEKSQETREWLIDKAEKEDAQAIAEIQVDAWKKKLYIWAPTYFVEQFNIATQNQKYIKRIKDPSKLVLVARDKSKLIGVIGVKPNKVEPLNYDQYIFGLYIASDYLRQGVGSALLGHLFEKLRHRQIKNVVVYTFAENIPARRLYESRGGVLLPYTDSIELDLKIPHVSYGFDITVLRNKFYNS